MSSSADENCIFCKIISKKEPAEILHEDNEVIVIKDIKPAARHHFLAIPKSHIKNINCLGTNDKSLCNKPDKKLVTLVDVGKRILQESGGNVDDLRLGFHSPPFNSVSHLHLHVISPVSEMSFFGRMVFKPNSWWFVTSDYVLHKLDANKL